MAGLLDRFLNGTGTDPINQAGGLEGYLNQFNVNTRYMPWMQAGNQFNVPSTNTGDGGLLNGTNPYEITQPTPQPQPQTQEATGPLTISGFLGQPRGGQSSGDTSIAWGNNKQGAGLPTSIVLSNGKTVSWDDFQKAGGMDGKIYSQVGDDISAIYSKLFGGQ